jgi:hypothetical protein
MKTEQQLLDLKKDVELAKNTTAELTGQLKGLKKQLQEEWSCKTSEEGYKEADKLLNKKQDKDQQIRDKTVELEEKYNV